MQTSVHRDPALRSVLFITFVVMLGFGLVAPALPLFAASFGVSYTAVGFLITGFGIVRLGAQPFGGRLVDRMGERRVAVLGVLIVGGSSLAAGLAPNYTALLIGRSLGGIGSAWFITSLTAYVMGLVPKDAVGRALSLYQGSFTAGITMGPVVGGLLADRFGLRAPFFAYAGFCLASGIIAARVLRRRQAERTEDVPDPVQKIRLPADRRYVIALVANVAIWWTFGASRFTLIPLYAKDQLGASEAWIGSALTLAAVASLVILPHAGRATDRSRLGVLLPALTASAGVVAILGFVGEQGYFLMAMAGIGIVQGYARVPMTAFVADVSDTRNRGRAVAVHQMAGDVGSLLGPVIAGSIATAMGFRTAFLVVALPVFLAAVFSGGLAMSRKTADV